MTNYKVPITDGLSASLPVFSDADKKLISKSIADAKAALGIVGDGATGPAGAPGNSITGPTGPASTVTGPTGPSITGPSGPGADQSLNTSDSPMFNYLSLSNGLFMGNIRRQTFYIPGPANNFGNGKAYIRLQPSNEANLASVKVTVQGGYTWKAIMGWLTAEYSYYAPGDDTVIMKDFVVTSTEGYAYLYLRLGPLEVENGHVSIPVWCDNTNHIFVTVDWYESGTNIKNHFAAGSPFSDWISEALPALNHQDIKSDLVVSGKVGIGVASPDYQFDVAGDVNCSGDFRVNGVPIGSGVTGPTGPSVTGPTGPNCTGPTGPAGADSTVTGPTGANSTVTGPTGAGSTVTGPTGAASTVTGPTGAASTVTGPTGANSTVTGPTGPNCTGPTGPAGTAAADVLSIAYFRHYGTTNYEAWYGPCIGSASMGSQSVASGLLTCVAFIVPRTITIDRIGVYVAGVAGGGNYRLGIYNDNGNVYPGSLLLDAGYLTFTTTGMKSITINQQLTAGLYWMCIICQNDNNNIYGTPQAGMLNLLGFTNAMVPNYGHFRITQAYGALPANAPTGGTPDSNLNIPNIVVRLSSIP